MTKHFSKNLGKDLIANNIDQDHIKYNLIQILSIRQNMDIDFSDLKHYKRYNIKEADKRIFRHL